MKIIKYKIVLINIVIKYTYCTKKKKIAHKVPNIIFE